MAELTELTHHRWNLRVLAALHARGGGAKFVTLTHDLGCGRSALSASLSHLVERQWIERSQGVAHPLRPEYRLARGAATTAGTCALVAKLLRRWDCERLGYQKWTLPVVAATGNTRESFNDLKRRLTPITARALTLTLKSLQEHAWVIRRVKDRYPPSSAYELSGRGLQLQRTLADL
ncbi:MAG: winged helix-turn-helix transcriptional regulator [Pseudomonadota bacterium]